MNFLFQLIYAAHDIIPGWSWEIYSTGNSIRNLLGIVLWKKYLMDHMAIKYVVASLNL